ncbi:hypothetical protein AMTRI_Chr08g208990 [Amborella trichopoda]
MLGSFCFLLLFVVIIIIIIIIYSLSIKWNYEKCLDMKNSPYFLFLISFLKFSFFFFFLFFLFPWISLFVFLVFSFYDWCYQCLMKSISTGSVGSSATSFLVNIHRKTVLLGIGITGSCCTPIICWELGSQEVAAHQWDAFSPYFVRAEYVYWTVLVQFSLERLQPPKAVMSPRGKEIVTIIHILGVAQ